MSDLTLFFVLVFCLVGLFSLTALNSAFRRLQKKDSKKVLSGIGKLFFYHRLHHLAFPQRDYEDLFFTLTFAQNAVRFCYAIFSLLIIIQAGFVDWNVIVPSSPSFLSFEWPSGVLTLLGLFLLFFIIGDYLARLLGLKYPGSLIRLVAPIASFFLLLVFPFSFIFLKLTEFFSSNIYLDHIPEPQAEAKQELIDIIQESNVMTQVDPHDKKLLESVMAFRERIAREVMVPRVEVFSLPHDTTIEEAAAVLLNEGYSRTPVYKNTLDNIIGVLMYKDILAKYMEYAEKGKDASILKAPIETLMKNILYTPETKKISQLLQEFRKKQVHLAIVVDEYGGTEGIVTIEDILEEIVGDIADEYDQEEALFIPLPEGGWNIDARMGILDIEEQLGIEIPQDGDYDTVGGYIFHETGMIPAKGFILKKPNFELEVLNSNDRCVEKVRIRALNSPLASNGNEKSG